MRRLLGFITSPWASFRSANRIDKIAIVFAWLFGTWFVLAATWGVFGRPLGGHIGAGHAATAMLAEQIVRWKIPYPAFDWFLATPPSKASYYCHHPFGMYWISAVFYALFGHRDINAALPAVLSSIATVPLLWGVGKQMGGRIGGAIAIAGFSVVPIAVGFANFFNLEVVCIAGTLLCMWGFGRYQEGGKKRHLLLSLVGAALAFSGDWIAYLFIGPMLGFGLVRGFLLRRWMPPVVFPRYATWWVWTSTTAVLLLVLFIGLILKAGKLEDLVDSAASRGGAASSTLEMTLHARRSWIEFSFTPLVIFLGKVASPICFLRLLIRRRDEEGYALWFLAGSMVHYIAFKGGADVHIYWPHYFAAYFALALVQLATTFGGALGRVLGWFKVRETRRWMWRRGFALFCGILPCIILWPNARAAVGVWRETGGRYNEKGRPIQTNGDLLFVLERVVKPRLAAGEWLGHHPSVKWGWEQDWGYASNRHRDAPDPRSNSLLWIARASGLEAGRHESLAAEFPVNVYGDLWVVETTAGKRPLDAFRVYEKQPNLWRWFWSSGTEPTRSVSRDPDPLLTWEWRVHVGQEAPLPSGSSDELDDIRILHNSRVFTHDAAGAASQRARIDKELDKSHTQDLPGVRLIGTRVVKGAGARVEAWFEATKPKLGAIYSIRSQIEDTPWSPTPPDPTVREMTTLASIPPALWREGFVYVISARLFKRIGREKYYGTWIGLRDVGAASTELTTLE
jgi:hypothetical protein